MNVNGLDTLHKNQSFPKSSKRRNLSSSSLPGNAPYSPTLSNSSSVDYGDGYGGGGGGGQRLGSGGGESGYCGSDCGYGGYSAHSPGSPAGSFLSVQCTIKKNSLY